MHAARSIAFGLVLALAAGSAVAEEDGLNVLSFGTQAGTPQNALYFTALLGAQSGPAYFGSDELEFGPAVRGGFNFLDLGRLTVGEPVFDDDPYARDDGFNVHASFRFIGERDASEYDDLKGMDDVDATLELGLGVGYVWPNLEVFADARYGIGGSDGWVGELGADFIARPTDRLTLRVGPRFLYGSENFTETYFGVSASESAASGMNAYDPDGGLTSAGVEMTATYRLGERWWLEGGARWDKYQDDAADSPIVRRGSDESTEAYIGFRRAFVLEF